MWYNDCDCMYYFINILFYTQILYTLNIFIPLGDIMAKSKKAKKGKYKCPYEGCEYSSNNIRSVLLHHYKKHGTKIKKEDVIGYESKDEKEIEDKGEI